MSRVLKIKDSQGVYFVTFTIVHWIDPVAARLVFEAEDYVHSSATAYVGRAVECPLDVVVLEVHGLNWNE